MSIWERDWKDTKAALMSDLPESKQEIVNSLLENTKKHYLAELEGMDELENLINPPEPKDVNKVLMPIIRRFVPMSIAHELVGVQPMTGPVGSIFSLRYINERSELERLIDDAQTVEEYLDTRPLSRKLKASWTIEPQQQLESQHGLDLENEMIAALSQDITNEIDQEILGEIQLMHYKGKEIFDEGYFYCPYVPRNLTPRDVLYRAFDNAKDTLGVINYNVIA